MPKLLNHRVAFNCDLFMTVSAPEDADTKALEQLCIKAIRERFDDGDVITAVPIPVGREHAHEETSHDMTIYLRDPRSHERQQAEGVDDEHTQLENFSIENVETEAAN